MSAATKTLLARPALGRLLLPAFLGIAVATSACLSEGSDSHATLRLQTTLRADEEISHLRLQMSAGEPPEVFYEETWRLGGAGLPELPATVTVKQGRAEAIHVVADALLGDFLVDRQEGELVFADPVRSHLTLELGPRFLCGNGGVDDGEECDCGAGAATSASCVAPNSDVLPDACRTDCRRAHCGDGVLDAAEACDDGNDVDEDACTSSCEVNVCGDGVPRRSRACWSRSAVPPFPLMTFPSLAGVHDLDGDGVPEVLAHSEVLYPDVHILGFQAGEGFHELQVITANAKAVYPGILDEDAELDLVIINTLPPEVRVHAGRGGAAFEAAPTSRLVLGDNGTSLGPSAAGDLDGDAILDVALVVESDVLLLGGDGLGGLAPFSVSPVALTEPVASVALEDVTGDARTDLLVLPYSIPELWLFPGDGQGVVGPKAPIPLGASPLRLLVGAFDEDDARDVVFIDELFRLWLYHGDGAGGFAPSPWSPLTLPLQPIHLAAGDVDGDGWVDLVLFESQVGRANSVAVAFAIGQPETAPEPVVFEGFSHRLGTPALADVDDDGDLDLLVPENDLFALHPLHMLRNDP